MLRPRLSLNFVPSTDLLELRVFDEDPNEAAALANGIARAYRELRNEQYKEICAQGLAALKKQLDEHKAKMAALQNKLQQEKRDLNISDETTTSNQLAAAAYFATKEDLETAQRWRDILRERLASYASPDPGPPPVQPVSILDPATPPSKPIRPNRPLGIAMLIAGLGLILGGIVTLKSPNSERLSVFEEKQ